MSGLGMLLAFALLAFVGVASAVLLWDGLAGLRNGHAAVRAHPRARLAAGAIGFAFALWLAFGLLSHAH